MKWVPKVCIKVSSAQVCFRSVNEERWLLYSGCARHITGEISMFSHFRDKWRGKIIGEGDIGTSSSKISQCLLVDVLKHNLLSISQLCDKGSGVIFESNMCSIQNTNDNKVHFVANRCGNVYSVKFHDLHKQKLSTFFP